MRVLLSVALAAAAPLPALAQPGMPEAYQPKPIYERCERLIDMRGLVNSQRIECATFDMDRADGALNAAYRVLVKHVPARRRQQLVADERTWIARRHAKCAAAHSQNVPDDLSRLWCLSSETDKRTAYLLSLA